jgi:hypothetical protein
MRREAEMEGGEAFHRSEEMVKFDLLLVRSTGAKAPIPLKTVRGPFDFAQGRPLKRRSSTVVPAFQATQAFGSQPFRFQEPDSPAF